MKPVLSNAWRYTILIIFLFVIIAVASRSVISHFEEEIRHLGSEQFSMRVSVAIWTLTMGCMFVAGALGLLAIRSASEAESRKRIGRFVEVMDYLSDGVLAVESNGVITGMNPTARKLAPEPPPHGRKINISQAFKCLSSDDIINLTNRNIPYEIERDCPYPNGLKKLRFRSQPSAGVGLVLLSDVTDMRARELRERQAAQLQMIGRIAGGVAHDFNNILCAISGHASLLKKKTLNLESADQSLETIINETHRGSQLSRQLLELSKSGVPEEPSNKLKDDVAEGIELLRIGLSQSWKVRFNLEDNFGTVPLSSRQIVQVVLNLGLLAANSLNRPGAVSISLCKPGKTHFSNLDDRYQVVIIVSAEHDLTNRNTSPLDEAVLPILDDSGVITSVVRSLIEEAGGIFQHLSNPDGLCVFRTGLPYVDTQSLTTEHTESVLSDISGYVSGWTVLLADEGAGMDAFRAKLEKLGANTKTTDGVVSLLSDIEYLQNIDVMVLHNNILGNEAPGLAKAIVRLCPKTGVVVLCNSSEKDRFESGLDIVCDDVSSPPNKLIRSMIEAKALASTRKIKT